MRSISHHLKEPIQFVDTLVKNSVAAKELDRRVDVRHRMSALPFTIQNAISDAILKTSSLVNSAQSLSEHKDK